MGSVLDGNTHLADIVADPVRTNSAWFEHPAAFHASGLTPSVMTNSVVIHASAVSLAVDHPMGSR